MHWCSAISLACVPRRALPANIFLYVHSRLTFHDKPMTQPLSAAEQLSLLLGDTLKVAFAIKLPSLDASRIRAFCLQTLRFQFLPQEVLAPKTQEILRSLMKCAEKTPDFKIPCLMVSIEPRAHTSQFFVYLRKPSTRSPQSFLLSTQRVSFQRSRNFSP